MLRRLNIVWVLLGSCLQICAESVPSQNQYVAQLKQESATHQLKTQNTLREAVKTRIETQLTEWGKATLLRNWKTTNNSTLAWLQYHLNDLNEITLVSENETQPSLSKTKSARKLTFGWNLKNNTSKIEYSEESLNLGFYQYQTWNFLIGQAPLTETLHFNLNKKWKGEKMSASLQFPVGLPHYSASISRELSTTISSTFSAQAPIRGTQLARRFELKVSFLF
jgi:hypothetical protein